MRAPGFGIVMLAAILTVGLAPPVRSEPEAPPLGAVLEIGRRARGFEDRGDYAQALAEWRRMRAVTPLDGDLELATALDEARAGHLDSAAVRLAGPILSAAAVDTLPASRYRSYAADRSDLYANGKFDGWHWYVWRARAEVAMARGRWDEATVAARACVAARPISGKEWLLLAVCAGRVGLADEARAAVRQATVLDATLPEVHYLAGVWAWRAGRRADAHACFRAAIAADPGMPEPAVSLARSRLPGTAPDSLPTRFLTGQRSVGMLTSTAWPKIGDHQQIEQAPLLTHREDPVLSDSLKAAGGPKVLVWLFVDDQGRVILNDLPWASGGGYPTPVIADLLKHLATWRFQPAKIQGAPRAIWADVQYAFPR